jgi:hypothetical protein
VRWQRDPRSYRATLAEVVWSLRFISCLYVGVRKETIWLKTNFFHSPDSYLMSADSKAMTTIGGKGRPSGVDKVALIYLQHLEVSKPALLFPCLLSTSICRGSHIVATAARVCYPTTNLAFTVKYAKSITLAPNATSLSPSPACTGHLMTMRFT